MMKISTTWSIIKWSVGRSVRKIRVGYYLQKAGGTGVIDKSYDWLYHEAVQELKINGVYRHFKGDYYLVVDVARHSETQEEYVVYRKLYGDGSLWVRPRAMFCSEVDHQKYPQVQQRYRFEWQDIPSRAPQFRGQ